MAAVQVNLCPPPSAPTSDTAGGSRSPASAERVAWVDVAKGIGIILVVYGHACGGLVDAGLAPRDGAAVDVSTLIYTFHMPLFFFLAGLWLVRASTRPFPRFLRDRAGTILYPYVLWSLIQFAANVCAARLTNAAPQPLGVAGILYRPYAQFWFFYVLFVDLALVCLLLKARFGIVLSLVVGAALYAMHPLAEGWSWRPAAPIMKHAVYVAAGAATGPWLVGMRVGSRGRDALIACASFAALLAVFWGASRLTLPGAAAASILGLTAVLATSNALTATLPGRGLQFLGKYSLEIYVAHVLGTAGARIFLLKGLGVTGTVPQLVAGMVAGLALPLGIVWMAAMLRLPNLYSLRRGGRRAASGREATATAPSEAVAA